MTDSTESVYTPCIIRNESAGFSEFVTADVPALYSGMFAANVERIANLSGEVIGYRVWDAVPGEAPAPSAREAEPGRKRPIFLPGWFGSELLRAAEAYLAEYVFDDGESSFDYEPTEFERMLLQDAINGIFGDDKFSSILQSLYPAPPPQPASAEVGGEVIEALEAARALIEDQFRDSSAEVDGEWLDKVARAPHAKICSAISALSHASPAAASQQVSGTVGEILTRAGCTTGDGTYVHAPMRDVVAALRRVAPDTTSPAAAPSLGGVPDGYVLVPREPTLSMFNALAAAFADSETGRLAMAQWSLGRFREDYQAMLAAAPSIEPRNEGAK